MIFKDHWQKVKLLIYKQTANRNGHYNYMTYTKQFKEMIRHNQMAISEL